MSRIAIFIVGLIVSFCAAAEQLEATVQWAVRVELASPVSGVIDKVAVRAGERVKSGQLLVALEPDRFKVQLVKAEALAKEAEYNKAEAERELERALELYDRTVLSDHAKQMAEIGAAQANAAWQSARAALAEARLALAQSRISAPFNGVVVELMTHPGEVVVSTLQATPLVVLADADKLISRARVSAEQLSSLSLDQAVEVGVAGQWIPGRIIRLGLEPVSRAGAGPLYEVDAIFTRKDNLPLRVGGPAVIRLN